MQNRIFSEQKSEFKPLDNSLGCDELLSTLNKLTANITFQGPWNTYNIWKISKDNHLIFKTIHSAYRGSMNKEELLKFLSSLPEPFASAFKANQKGWSDKDITNPDVGHERCLTLESVTVDEFLSQISKLKEDMSPRPRPSV